MGSELQDERLVVIIATKASELVAIFDSGDFSFVLTGLHYNCTELFIPSVARF